eukprot:13545585-Ditylum_brightwellii.AAC.1
MDNANRGKYLCLVNDRLGMSITQSKESKVLQAMSTVMQPGTTAITRCAGQEVIGATCPNGILLYQQYMSGFYTVVAKEMMNYTDGVDDNDNNICQDNDPLHGHSPAPIPQDYDI